MADWERVAVERNQGSTDHSAWSVAFYLRVCPRCAATVLDNDDAQETHYKWHSLSAVGMDFGVFR